MTTVRFAHDTNLYGLTVPAGTVGELFVANVVSDYRVKVKITLNMEHFAHLVFLSPTELNSYIPKHENTVFFRCENPSWGRGTSVWNNDVIELEIQWNPTDKDLINVVRALRASNHLTFGDTRTVQFIEYLDACDAMRVKT